MKLETFFLRILAEVRDHKITVTEAFDRIAERMAEEFDKP